MHVRLIERRENGVLVPEDVVLELERDRFELIRHELAGRDGEDLVRKLSGVAEERGEKRDDKPRRVPQGCAAWSPGRKGR